MNTESVNLLFLISMIIYLGASLFFGIRKSKQQDQGTKEDWFVAGGKVAWMAIGFTMAAAWLDMATVFLNAGSGSQVGISAFWYLAGAEMIAFLVCGFVFGKPIRRTKMISQGEMLEKRFGEGIKPWISIIWVISLSGYAALSFLVFQEFMQYFYGVSAVASAVICLAIVLTLQLIGGFAASVYADYIQGVLIIVGSVLLGIFAVKNAGGMAHIQSVVPPSFLSPFGIGIKEVLMITVPLVLAFVVEPTLWMRITAAKSLKDAKKSSVFAFLIYIPVCAGTLLAGLAAYVLYPNWAESTDLITVQMANDFFPPIIIILVLVGIMAAMFSSFNAFMSAANLELAYDFVPYIYKKISKKEFPESKYRFLSRICLVFIGILGTFIALWLPTLLDILLFAGTLAAAGLFWPVFAMFFIKKVNYRGAVWSFALGSISQLAFSIFGTPWGIDPFLLSFPLSFIGLIAGTLTGKPATQDQLKLFFPGKDEQKEISVE